MSDPVPAAPALLDTAQTPEQLSRATDRGDTATPERRVSALTGAPR
jgi:hypothetical protein